MSEATENNPSQKMRAKLDGQVESSLSKVMLPSGALVDNKILRNFSRRDR